MLGRKSKQGQIRVFLWSYPESSTLKIAEAIGAGRAETERLLSNMWGREEVVLTNKGWKLGAK